MIKIYLNEDKKLIMNSDSLPQSYVFLWTLAILLRLLDSWLIMVFIGGIHHIFNTNWLPPSFLTSLFISVILTAIKFSNSRVQEALKEMGLK